MRWRDAVGAEVTDYPTITGLCIVIDDVALESEVDGLILYLVAPILVFGAEVN